MEEPFFIAERRKRLLNQEENSSLFFSAIQILFGLKEETEITREFFKKDGACDNHSTLLYKLSRANPVRYVSKC